LARIYKYLLLSASIVFHSHFLLSQNSQLILKSVSHRIPPYTDHWKYDVDGMPISILCTTQDSLTAIMFYDFQRDANKVLQKVEVKDVNYSIAYSYIYYYNNAKQIERIDKMSDIDFDGKADDLDYSFTINYDTLGRVSRMRIKKEFTLARDFHFIWKEGNIVRVENTDGELNYTMNLAFDDKPNALERIKWEYITTTGTLEFYAAMFCKNNLVSATLFPAAMDSAVLEIMPSYNEDGLYISNGMEGVEYHY